MKNSQNKVDVLLDFFKEKPIVLLALIVVFSYGFIIYALHLFYLEVAV